MKNMESQIVREISKYVDLKECGSNYVGICPFHDENKNKPNRNHFLVHTDSKIWNCSICNKGGPLPSLLIRIYQKKGNNNAVVHLSHNEDDYGILLPSGKRITLNGLLDVILIEGDLSPIIRENRKDQVYCLDPRSVIVRMRDKKIMYNPRTFAMDLMEDGLLSWMLDHKAWGVSRPEKLDLTNCEEY